jgi:hypothetical protein
MNLYSNFAAALLDPSAAYPPGLRIWDDVDPGKRFAIYRNNVIASLVDALADTYPVVQALVGIDFFRAMAREFVYHSPPRSPLLAGYGAEFPDFIESFPPALGLPYLADVARLEWMRLESCHAADTRTLSEAELTQLLRQPEQLPAMCFELHPALRVLRSTYPVLSLWVAHQIEDPGPALESIDMECGEAVLLVRPGFEVEMISIESATATLITGLQSGLSLGQLAQHEEGDMAATLALLIRSNALTGTLPVKDVA